MPKVGILLHLFRTHTLVTKYMKDFNRLDKVGVAELEMKAIQNSEAYF